MNAVRITIHQVVLPHDDPGASLAFYRDALGFEVRGDVGAGAARRVTVGPADQPGTSLVLEPRATDRRVADGDEGWAGEPVDDGGHACIALAATGLDEVFERLEASGAEVIQEPIERPSGVRDCAFLDPAGNLIRISEAR